MRVLSLGAGVQSTTLLFLAFEGKVQAEAAVFADTGAEPKKVYEHLWKIAVEAALHDFPLIVCQTGDLREDILHPKGKTQPAIPVFVAKPGGKRGRLARHCTRTYKIEAIRRELRKLLGVGPLGRPAGGKRATSLIGISTDEIERMRTNSDVQWIDLEYPLIDLGMSRDDCIAYLAERGWLAPKSSCSFCPFHSDAYWAELKADPEEWVKVVAFDRAIRHDTLRGVKHPAYLHASLQPIDEVELKNRPDTFGEDCSGTCGVDL